MRQDFFHLARTLRRSPASAVAAVVTLSLTLGAGASIFAIVDAVLLTPPPFADPNALVTVGERPLDQPAAAPRTVRFDTFEAWRERARGIAQLEASDGTNFTMTGVGSATRVQAAYVTLGHLPMLGVSPVRGRMFDSTDEGRTVAIVSHRFWQGTLAGDAAVTGRQIALGGQPYTIIGVLPEGFAAGGDSREIWVPIGPRGAVGAAAQRVGVIARLAPTASAADLERALSTVSAASTPAAQAVATPIAMAIAGEATRTLGVLAGAVVLALFMAFTNLAGLLMVRTIDRRRELAIRTALGARRFEIVRLVMLEAQALVAIGVGLGVVLALWLTPVVAALSLERFASVANRDVTLSWRVIVAVTLAASACAALCGVLPALLATRRGALDVIRRGATPPRRELMMRRLFVGGEVALAFVLIVSMMLLGRSLMSVLRVNPGFTPGGVLALAISLPGGRYNGPQVASFYQRLERALTDRLGERSTAFIDELPLSHSRGRTLTSTSPAGTRTEAVARTASDDYFDVMRIPIIAGRSFTAADGPDAPTAVAISESLARRLFGTEGAIGRRVWLNAGAVAADVVGVVGDVRHAALDEPIVPTIYRAPLQLPSNTNVLTVRSVQPAADLIAVVREEVARLDADVPVYANRTMDDIVARSPGVPARRVMTAAFTASALLAVALGAIGLFGVAAHDVARRRAELALRMALGADPRRILRATLAQGIAIVAGGIAVGGLFSIWTGRMLGALAVAPSGFDLVSVAIAAALLVLVGAVAVLPAARRAAQTDPLAALRSE